MSSIRVLVVADHKNSWTETAVHEYLKKISFFCKFSVEVLKPLKMGRADASEKQKRESELILSKIKDKEYVILCDERGITLDSKGFAKKLQDMLDVNPNPKCFVIGGTYGSSADLKQRADVLLKLSDLTLNHHVALVNLLEQIYRGFSIIKNLPYHNE